MDCARNGAPDLGVPIAEGPEGKRHPASGVALEREDLGKVTELDSFSHWFHGRGVMWDRIPAIEELQWPECDSGRKPRNHRWIYLCQPVSSTNRMMVR